MPLPALIASLATAVPSGALSSARSAEIMAALAARNDREAARVRAAARMSGIDRRHCAAADSDDPDAACLPLYANRPEGASRIPGTAERMAVFAREAPLLAERAARLALEKAGLAPEAVTHLVVATCTGFFAPGLDFALIQALGLPRSVSRTQLGFMGCHAALNALAAARGLVLTRPDAAALVVCVELCALHFQYSVDRDAMVPNMLFADGAAAMILRPGTERPETPAPPLELLDTASLLLPDSADAMTWTIGDAGFRMTLGKRTPDLIAQHLKPAVAEFLGRHGLAIGDAAGWAIHPGGPRIIESVLAALGLPEEAAGASRRILRERGNMSSPTVLFIAEELLARGTRGPILAVAFGPGLAAEMALLRAGGE
jgi:predicted naringenin-chalcone synthase